ncbi:MAG: translation initiation factor IF-2 subunit alpha [Archaeoglobaceae archaeon]|nr:translation initiation factor IF-2 subunit alpha [Archaeoglobaceae archaeon]MCX8151741.1 translation initiation factor IF-2 subunit alpha [Archaeoglobaceae archaeon]MDW8014289.1 translation initiation factor IF-2 subunit alpha [Archaeoglobaceae archaeon]
MSEEVERFIVKRSGYPAKGEIVIGTVSRVLDFGAFVTLDEYENKEGFVHISEVASGWIKDIRDHVKKGQKVVCKVLDVNPKRGHIDLSMKDVTERQKKDKISLWKNEMKAFKWLEIIGEKLKIDKKELEKIGKKIIKEYDSVYSAFEDAAFEGYEVLKPIVGEEFAKSMAEIAMENIKPQKVKVRGYFEIKCPGSDGIDRIKKILAKAEDKNAEVNIEYVGAPRYRVVIVAEDYKVAEKALKRIVEVTTREAKKLSCECKFVREAV